MTVFCGIMVVLARPVQCSTYPFWDWMIKDGEIWQECAEDCPGMNKGRVWTVEEIEKNKSEYVHNIPLKKEDIEILYETSEKH